MKKFAAIAIAGLALLTGGCAMGFRPISPLLFLLKNVPAPLPQMAPDHLAQPAPLTLPEGAVDAIMANRQFRKGQRICRPPAK